MKIWAITRKNNRIVLDKIFEDDILTIEELIFKACAEFDIGRPVILSKHEAEIDDFRRTIFYPADFIETVKFDRFEVEIIDEEDK